MAEELPGAAPKASGSEPSKKTQRNGGGGAVQKDKGNVENSGKKPAGSLKASDSGKSSKDAGNQLGKRGKDTSAQNDLATRNANRSNYREQSRRLTNSKTQETATEEEGSDVSSKLLCQRRVVEHSSARRGFNRSTSSSRQQ